MSSSMLSTLQAGMFVLLVIFFIFLICTDENYTTTGWFAQLRSTSRRHFNAVVSQLHEDEYVIPPHHRKPELSVKEYYKQREEILFAQMMSTRNKYQQQYHIGTVMKDGFHTDLPDNAMWRNGKVEMSAEIAELRSKAETKL